MSKKDKRIEGLEQYIQMTQRNYEGLSVLKGDFVSDRGHLYREIIKLHKRIFGKVPVGLVSMCNEKIGLVNYQVFNDVEESLVKTIEKMDKRIRDLENMNKYPCKETLDRVLGRMEMSPKLPDGVQDSLSDVKSRIQMVMEKALEHPLTPGSADVLKDLAYVYFSVYEIIDEYGSSNEQ